MDRRTRAGWLALAASLLLHAALLAGLVGQLPAWETPTDAPVIEARLAERAPPVVAPVSSPKPRVRPRPAPSAPPVVQASVPLQDAAVPDTVPEPPAAETEPARIATVEAPVAPAPAVDALPPLNPLPPRVDMRFSMHYGFASGEQTLLWVNDGAHYTLTSVASATGLAGVFYRGRLVQTSGGRVTPAGLQPDEFWDQRGDRRSSARFDHAAGRVTLTGAQGTPRQIEGAGDAQDLLSVLFQLALTAPPAAPVRYTVFNGKKLREYTFESRGEVELDTALGTLRTLHLTRVADAGGRFEVWLAVDRHFLPVRVLRGDEDGNVAELRVLSIAP